MKVVADLHLHSKYSRAVSQQMVLPEMAKWAKRKGIDLLGTGDFTHPLWFRELKAGLEEVAPGLFSLKSARGPVGLHPHQTSSSGSAGDAGARWGSPAPATPRLSVSDSRHPSPLFLLSTEISSIYSQGGKLRRIHNLVFAPSLETVEKINQALLRRGANLMSDGRPIIGLSARDLVELVLSVDQDCLLIPAHCLLPTALIHTKDGVKRMQDVQVGDRVYTHMNRARQVTQVFRRPYKGNLYHIRPWYFSPGLATTSEHPLYALKLKKCPTKGDKCLPTVAHKMICKKKIYETYRPEWIMAKNLAIGDVLIFPRFQNATPVGELLLNVSQNYAIENRHLLTGGTRGRIFPDKVRVDKEFCRLVGYYLAEGYTNGRDEIGFAFHKNEEDYVVDVATLMNHVFGIDHHRIYQRRGSKSIEISFYSKLLVGFFTKLFYSHYPYRALTKTIPDDLLHLPIELQAELFRGWWRGDRGYTSSVQLMNGMKIICLRLGIIPSIFQDTKEKHLRRGKHQYLGRSIRARGDSYVFTHLSFFEDPYSLLSDPAFKKSIRKLNRRHGWIDKDYIYLPVRKIEEISYEGEVLNFEVKEDNSYVAEFATVHNCWTPWFSLYGSESGFDSLSECFGELSKSIFAIETGLSSDPAMNWRIAELDGRQILSFSDAHSPAKLGREATVFASSENGISNFSYQDIRDAIMGRMGRLKISHTIEFYPEEGKYHYTGHRNCKVRQSPKETQKQGTTCPVCGKGLTVGVMHRVQQLARQTQNSRLPSPGGEATGGQAKLKTQNNEVGVRWVFNENTPRPPYVMLVPLLEILSEAMESVLTSQKVINEYNNLTDRFESELAVLLTVPIEDIAKVSGKRVAEGVEKVREGDIIVEPGYDGEYGVVKIWPLAFAQGKAEEKKDQLSLF